MKPHDEILILDFGSQYTQLIARRIRECRVYCEIVPFNVPLDAVRRRPLKGVVLSGGPMSVLSPDSPVCDPGVFELGVPVLGICYGLQLTARLLGGEVRQSIRREYGRAAIRQVGPSPLLDGVPEETVVWMSHGDDVRQLPRTSRLSWYRTMRSPHADTPVGASSCCSFIPRWHTRAKKGCASSGTSCLESAAAGALVADLVRE